MTLALRDRLRAGMRSAGEWFRDREDDLAHGKAELEAKGHQLYGQAIRKGEDVVARTTSELREFAKGVRQQPPLPQRPRNSYAPPVRGLHRRVPLPPVPLAAGTSRFLRTHGVSRPTPHVRRRRRCSAPPIANLCGRLSATRREWQAMQVAWSPVGCTWRTTSSMGPSSSVACLT